MNRLVLSAMAVAMVACLGCSHSEGHRTDRGHWSGLSPEPKSVASEKPANAIRIELSLEGAAHAPVTIATKDKRLVREVSPGQIDLDVSGLPEGRHYLYFESPGYASRWVNIVLPNALSSDAPIEVELFRERFVVIRWAFNTTGGRSLAGSDVREGRVAVTHWGKLEFFGGDWQIWQGGGAGQFGKVPFLQFHRQTRGFGLVETPEGTSFDDLKEASASGYQCSQTTAVKGAVFMCRVNGNRREGLGYGKILIEDVTEEPPQGIPVIRRGH